MKHLRSHYLMEYDHEGTRLRTNRKAEMLADIFRKTGLLRLPETPLLVDAGSGSGFVSEIVMNLMHEFNYDFRLIQFDFSLLRLREGKRSPGNPDIDKCRFINGSLEHIGLADNSADVVFSTFVFEFLAEPEICFRELLRILKPGGRLIIVDLDYNCLTHYPITEQLESQLHEIGRVLATLKMFDVNIGRKLYYWFRMNGLRDISVNMSAHHLFYGDLAPHDDANWTAKFRQIEELQNKGHIDLSFLMKDFNRDFLALLRSPHRFSYTPCFIVEGIK